MDYRAVVSSWGLDPDLLQQQGAYYADIWCRDYPNNRPALIVPTGKDTRARAMFLDGKLPKYHWLPGDQRPRPILFDPAGVLETGPNRVILSNGDKTTLLLAQLGIPAVSTFGEGNQATEVAACLSAAGVKALVNYPDSDGKGIKAAHKWLKVGFEAGIDVITLDYGQWLVNQFGGEPAAYDGHDLRDLYLRLDQDRARFLAALDSMKPIQWECYSDLLPKEKSHSDYTAEGTEDLPARFLMDVKRTLGIEERYNSEGFTRKAVKCPLKNHAHDDIAPAFYWHKNNFGKCHKCHAEGETANAKAVGTALGIHLREYYDTPCVVCPAGLFGHPPLAASDSTPLSAAKNDAATGEMECYHLPKTPDPLRKLFLNFNRQFPQYEDQTPALICLEVIWEAIRAGDLDPASDLITRPWIAAYGSREVKETTARTGLDQLTALGCMTRIDSSGAAQYKLLPIADWLDNLRRIMVAQYRQGLYKPQKHITAYGEMLDPVPADITPAMIALECPDFSQEQLHYAAEVLNQDRTELYRDFAEARTEADHKLQNEVRRLGAVLSLEGLLMTPSTPLEATDRWANSSAYRASFYRARVRWRLQRQLTITQTQAAAEIGISPKALYTLRLKHGIALDEQFMEIPVNAPTAVFEVMPAWAARRDYGNELVSGSGKKISATRTADRQAVIKWATAEIKGGHTVILRIQIGSQERFATAEERAAMEAKCECQREAARARRAAYEEHRRGEQERQRIALIETALQETITDLDPRWIKAQLDLKPGWDLLLEGIALGATISLQKLPTEEKPSLSSIGNFNRFPDRAGAALPLAPPKHRLPPAPKTPAEIMWNFPYWQVALEG